MTVMLSEKNQHSIIEYVYIPERRLVGALSLVMQYLCREIPVDISSEEQTIREVYILAIHKEVLIEESYIVECASSEHTEGSAHYLYLLWTIPWKVA